MWIFPSLHKIIKIETSSQLVDLIALFINDIRIIVISKSIKINCVSRVIRGISVVHLIRCNLIEILRVRVTTFLIVTHVIHVVVRVRIVIISLT